MLSSNDTFAPVDSAVRDPKSRRVSSRKVPSAFLQRNAKPTNQKVPVVALWLHYLLFLPLCFIIFHTCHLSDSCFCCCCRSSCHCSVSKSFAGHLASQWPVPLTAPGSFVAVHPVVTRALQHAAWKLAPPGPGWWDGVKADELFQARHMQCGKQSPKNSDHVEPAWHWILASWILTRKVFNSYNSWSDTCKAPGARGGPRSVPRSPRSPLRRAESAESAICAERSAWLVRPWASATSCDRRQDYAGKNYLWKKHMRQLFQCLEPFFPTSIYQPCASLTLQKHNICHRLGLFANCQLLQGIKVMLAQTYFCMFLPVYAEYRAGRNRSSGSEWWSFSVCARSTSSCIDDMASEGLVASMRCSIQIQCVQSMHACAII